MNDIHDVEATRTRRGPGRPPNVPVSQENEQLISAMADAADALIRASRSFAAAEAVELAKHAETETKRAEMADAQARFDTAENAWRVATRRAVQALDLSHLDQRGEMGPDEEPVST